MVFRVSGTGVWTIRLERALDLFHALRQSFHLGIFSNSQELVQLFLSNIDLPMAHEVKYRHQVSILYAFQVQLRMLMSVATRDGSE